MAKTWVLDTDTKGTGAQMVPLEKVLRRPAAEPELNLVPLNRAAPAAPVAEPLARQPRRFKVVDLMTRETLLADASMRATLDALRDVRSVVDVRVYVWQPHRRSWRPLTLAEQNALWEFRAVPARSSRSSAAM
jgi:hypothetical protein